MKKIILLFSLLLLISVPSASAHPGSTDSNGGHYNQSTGEYHYHHGYDDHQHYDMDGDGIADCPYNFKDKTSSSSGTSGSGSKSTTSSCSVVTISTQKRKVTFLEVLFTIFKVIVLFSLSVICLFVVVFLLGYLSSKLLSFIFSFFH